MTRTIACGLTALLAVVTLAAGAAWAEDKDGLSQTDRLLIRAQEICPVTGNDLESMTPVKATVEGQTVFLCCKGCFGKPIQKEHWAKVNANLIAAQGKCPVFDKRLSKNPKSTLVEGRIVFVCCPPCTKKIEADPERYLTIVNRYLQENLKK